MPQRQKKTVQENQKQKKNEKKQKKDLGEEFSLDSLLNALLYLLRTNSILQRRPRLFFFVGCRVRVVLYAYDDRV